MNRRAILEDAADLLRERTSNEYEEVQHGQCDMCTAKYEYGPQERVQVRGQWIRTALWLCEDCISELQNILDEGEDVGDCEKMYYENSY